MDDRNRFDAFMPSAQRARWLAELAFAVDQAECVAAQLENDGRGSAEILELKVRLGQIRKEVEELRLGGWRASPNELGSKRINFGSG